jgi:hypothetical protein
MEKNRTDFLLKNLFPDPKFILINKNFSHIAIVQEG